METLSKALDRSKKMPMQEETLSKKGDIRLHMRVTASCTHLYLRKPKSLSERIRYFLKMKPSVCLWFFLTIFRTL